MPDRDKLAGRVALVTGAARGQGRSHAIRLAQLGADVVALDLCAQIDSVTYPMATPADLTETVDRVQAEGGRAVGVVADVRDADALAQQVAVGVEELGSVDIVVANAAIAPMSVEPSAAEWGDVLDVNLTGVYNTVTAVVPAMIDAGKGGSIVLISSVAGLTGAGGDSPGMLAYTAAKHGVVGLMKAWANYLGPHNIRVNCVAPAGVRTPMVLNDAFASYLEAHPDFGTAAGGVLPGVGLLAPSDISSAVTWLVSDDARYVTGITLPVDAGAIVRR